jgi:glycosyltransferase involved in cell wall biosynthesis
MPAVSVLLPVRDAGRFLLPSLASLTRQTFRDFEIVAVNDGSRDGSGERLERLARREPRLRVVHSEPIGLPSALNLALAHARAPWIARHDADDLSHPLRFEAQHAWLTAHRTVSVLGCRVRLFPPSGVTQGMRRWMEWQNAVLTHAEIQRDALIDSTVTHGTAMMRRASLERVGGWREVGLPEDMDLWLRLLGDGARFAKLPDRLYGWRQHAASATRRDPRYRPERFDALRRQALAGFLRDRSAITLVGVGRSLARWRDGAFPETTRLLVCEAARPTTTLVAGFQTPLVLIFGARPARERWRQALTAYGKSELDDFIFVC